jgi:hypothetical protein
MMVSNFFDLQHFVLKKGVYSSLESFVKFQTARIENVCGVNANSIIIIIFQILTLRFAPNENPQLLHAF